MTRTLLARLALIAAGFALSVPSRARAQGVIRDATTGDFVLTFQDLDNAQHQMLLPAIDLMAPTLSVTATATPNGEMHYRYVLGNGTERRSRPGRGPSMVWIRCPSDANWRGTNGWSSARLHPSDGFLCRFLSGDGGVDPGDSVAFAEATTTLLPVPVNARIVGEANVPGWPVETDRVPQRVLDIADSLTSVEYGLGGGALVLVVIPGMDPADVNTPSATINVLRGYASFACDIVMWISPKGVCRSLTAKLDELKRSVADGHLAAARGAAGAALRELDALEASQHVAGSADGLLRPLLLRIVSLLQ